MNRFRNILLVDEPDVDQDAVVARALALADGHQARLSVLHVARRPRLGSAATWIDPARVDARLREWQRARLESMFPSRRDRGPDSFEVRFGTPFLEVVRDVLREGRDLVIKAAGAGGALGRFFSSIDAHLLRKCPCPVWILRAGGPSRYRRVIAAVDLEPWKENAAEDALNRRIFELAASVALADHAELHLVHAWEAEAETLIRTWGSGAQDETVAAYVDTEQRAHRRALESLDARLRTWVGEEAYGYLSPVTHLRRGNPRTVIPETAGELGAELVVMGTVSRTGIPGLIIGNTAEDVLEMLDCSVLAVKPEGFVSPVELAEG